MTKPHSNSQAFYNASLLMLGIAGGMIVLTGIACVLVAVF